ncbi:MAG: lysine--tRNA ligase [Candidatus Sungbacteria bacterium]|nr:lysine--tRNA ligase [Candidatus Sungbacteria bacterium]
MALEDIRRERVRKLESYEAAGFDAYPASVRRSFLIAEVLKKFPALARSKKKVSLVGRVRSWREHGGATFADLKDASGSIQLYFSRDELGRDYDSALASVDIGDFLEATGSLFKTKRGEPTLRVSEWRMVSKSLRPLPEKWHGLKDVEERFRRRYLDLLMNDGVRERFRMRSKIVKRLREFLDGETFEEVETPMLQPVAGGALAKPFRTHHNALDTDFYLRIAPELYLKRLLVGGYEKVFEIGRNFRNEGIDATHNPEFTMLELYAAYWSEDEMMAFVEKLFLDLLKAVMRKSAIKYDGKDIAWKKSFPRIPFVEILKRYALITDYSETSREELALKARRFAVEVAAHESKGKIADEIYKKICRPHLIQPTFVVNHPIEISPLAKMGDRKSGEVRRFQLIVGGLEMVNGFAELNDPRDQRRRFEEQARERAGGDAEAHAVDEDFIETLEYGMPSAAGIGIGIDRLVMLLTDTRNIKEAILFPTMRPR